MQFNDLRAFEVRRGHRGETLGKYCADGKVRRHHDAGARRALFDDPTLFLRKARRADDERNAVLGTPRRGTDDALGRREVDHDVDLVGIDFVERRHVGCAKKLRWFMLVDEGEHRELFKRAEPFAERLTHATGSAHDDQ